MGTRRRTIRPRPLATRAPTHLGQHVYKPFGTGTRACIRCQFAYHEIILTLAHVLRAFDLEHDPDYRRDITEQITLKPRGFTLRLTPRT
ncbi:cytochrome P450 [Nocardia donostiensis]|uniref:cytochrome P450 n=1 Tax=Nocardia donostiensis TaxID=1538463 RepID=UPI0020CA4F14|nr:cytochrome P450 [Nocardia donostiensis]